MSMIDLCLVIPPFFFMSCITYDSIGDNHILLFLKVFWLSFDHIFHCTTAHRNDYDDIRIDKKRLKKVYLPLIPISRQRTNLLNQNIMIMMQHVMGKK